jgi:hypothetical protein
VVQALRRLTSTIALSRVPLAFALSTSAALAAGCSVAPADYSSDADTGSTHGLITIERSQIENSGELPRATAFAGFVRTPPEVDANAMMHLAGFGLDLPAVGLCAEPSRERDSSVPLSPLSRVEFLDAGEVTLRTATTSAALATRAFPAVTDLIAGVVYTTRDRTAEPLPAATTYSLSTSGGVVRAVNVTANAPALLSEVTVGSTPLAELGAVSVRAPLTLSWNRGLPGDLVYIELTTQDGSATTRCTFRDDAGAGNVPPGAFVAAGAGELSLHRVHSEAFTSGSVDAGEVRFDFEQSAHVEFSD